MNLEYTHLISADLNPQSRVWIYQSNRLFSMHEALEIEEILNNFISNWKSHGAEVKGAAHLFFGQFIILIADNTDEALCGSTMDSSIRLIKDIEKQFGVSLLDRNMLAFLVKDKIELLPVSQLNYAFSNGYLNNDTLYFNNLAMTKYELENNWIISLKDSWLANKLLQLNTN